MRQAANPAPIILNSWKEIAKYIGRGVRTVQRWERELGLPVHRIGKGKRSPVYASVNDVKFWISTVEVVREKRPQPVLVQKPDRAQTGDGASRPNPLAESRRLLSEARDLARSIAENSVRQQRQAEELRARILEMRSRIR